MLVIDAGNSEIDCGYFTQPLSETPWHWRFPTASAVSATALHDFLRQEFNAAGLTFSKNIPVVFSTVVPSLLPIFTTAFAGHPFHHLTHQSPLSFIINLPRPELAGTDRLANVEAAYHLSGAPAIIVDAGTATTFSILATNNQYIGGAIAPGMMLAAAALTHRAAQLVSHSLVAPKSYVANNTQEALASGCILGHAAMIDAMIDKIRTELALPPTTAVIATGGCIAWLEPHLQNVTHVDAQLTLKGLYLLGQRLWTSSGIAAQL